MFICKYNSKKIIQEGNQLLPSALYPNKIVISYLEKDK